MMPDFFKGKPFPVDKYPPQGAAQQAELQLFFGTTANPLLTLPYVKVIGEELKKEGVVKIGTLGFCWGGKISIKCGTEDWVNGVAAIHPA